MSSEWHNVGNRCSIGVVLLAIVAGICLVISLFAAGFAACASPWATRALSGAFADFDTAPYLPEDVIELAVATRNYTVTDCGRTQLGTEGARKAFSKLLVESAQRASAGDSPVQSRWNASALAVLQRIDAADANATAYALADVSERYGLTQDALQHLDDCHALIGGVVPWLVASAVVAAALLSALFARGWHKLVGAVLFFAPIALVAFMALCGTWAAMDFNGFFGVFHALLFPQGNWTFPADSLLICMLPSGFWVSMGTLWLAVTALACIIAMLLGRRLRQDRRGAHRASR